MSKFHRMSQKRKEKQDGMMPPGWLLLIRLLMVGAIGISGYLAFKSLSGGMVAGCGPESNCDKVLHSRWAYWFGIPVSLPALLVYIAVLVLTFRLGSGLEPEKQRSVWPWLLAGAVLLSGAALWFIGLQMFALHTFCPFCMTGHTLGLVAAIILFANAPIRPAPEKPWQQEKQVWLSPGIAHKFAVAAVIALAVLAAGQTLHRQKLFSVQGVAPIAVQNSTNVVSPTNGVSSVTASTNQLVSAEHVTPSVAPATNTPPASASPPAIGPQSVPAFITPTNALGGNVVNHRLQIYRGLFQFDLREVPVLGSPDAPYAMLSLFDYTCHHCRQMHPLLVDAQRIFSNKLAIVNLPMPLDARCNYTVRRTPTAHTNACAIAKLGLSVWRANPAKQTQFDDFVFGPEKPPTIQQAVGYAEQLVGTEALTKAAQDPWVEEQMRRSISIYATNYFHIRNGSMPQLMINTNLITGTLEKTKDILQVLEKQLGLRASE
jgi:uncharacterized membrane protein